MTVEDREYSPKRFAINGVSCPACHAKVAREANWCESCGFTGANTIEMFGEAAPPLLPILDVADLWDEAGQRRIATEVSSFRKRFPQVSWRICAVALGPEVTLPLFGFWLLNASPLSPGETPEEREWSVLLLIDSNSGRASVTTGYRAEVWLSDGMWNAALAEIAEPLLRGNPDKAVVIFLGEVRKLFEAAWERSRKQLATR